MAGAAGAAGAGVFRSHRLWMNQCVDQKGTWYKFIAYKRREGVVLGT